MACQIKVQAYFTSFKEKAVVVMVTDVLLLMWAMCKKWPPQTMNLILCHVSCYKGRCALLRTAQVGDLKVASRLLPHDLNDI